MNTIKSKEDIVIGLTDDTSISTAYMVGMPSKRLKLRLDYTGVSVEKLLSWSTANRVIAFQRKLRELPTQSAFDGFHDGFDDDILEIFALEAGLKLENHSSDKDEFISRIF